MESTPFRSVASAALPCIVILAFFAANGCGGEPDSNPGESREAVPGQEASGTDMAREAESAAAQRTEEAGEHGEGHEGNAGDEHREGGEHDGEGEHGEHGEAGEHGEEGEESGEYLGRTQTWDATRRGMRLTLSFDEAQGAFTGTVENTTEATICNVRVEVHLSDGTELGPTAGMDLAAGESAVTRLPSGGESFERWTAHPESSRCTTG
ncbi:MAG: hypothetical protein F4X15_13775 [Gemmatimonadetes bacterium]|nr:hypothetical protein [Gemmatimonadota bacterium]